MFVNVYIYVCYVCVMRLNAPCAKSSRIGCAQEEEVEGRGGARDGLLIGKWNRGCRACFQHYL